MDPFTAASTKLAPLLPKIRGYIAEFLNEVSLLRLSILYSPTCVGLRYGRPDKHIQTFLGGQFEKVALAVASAPPLSAGVISLIPRPLYA